MSVVIRSTGLWTPEETVSNDELVACFNAYVEKFNAEHADALARGAVEPLTPSSSAFCRSFSALSSRYLRACVRAASEPSGHYGLASRHRLGFVHA